MLEGKEVEVPLGQYGSASLDIDDQGGLELSVTAKYKVNLVEELKKLAEKTSTPVDDAALAWVEGMLFKVKA